MANKGRPKKITTLPPVTGPRWYVVQSRFGREADVAFNLKHRLKFETYYPKRAATSRLALHPQPFFPTYLFCRMEMGIDVFREVADAPGVAGILRIGNRPAPIADSLVARVRSREVEGLVVIGPQRPSRETPLGPCPYEAGERVKVLDGPFRGFEAVFSCRVDAQRIRILLSFLGSTDSSVPAVISLDGVTKSAP